MMLFKVVCFLVLHPRGGRRGELRTVLGSVRINSDVIAANNFCNIIVSVARRSIVMRFNGGGGYHVPVEGRTVTRIRGTKDTTRW